MLTRREIQDLFISWFTISLAFAYNIAGSSFITILPTMFIVVGTAFVLHEMGHKFAAIRLGYYAEYRAWTFGLVLAVLLAMTVRVVFAAPGAVYVLPSIFKRPNRRDDGIISLAGPMVNLFVAAISLAILLFTSIPPSLHDIVYWVASVNAFIGFFNMLPFYPLDGSKVLAWDPRVYFGVFLLFLWFLIIL